MGRRRKSRKGRVVIVFMVIAVALWLNLREGGKPRREVTDITVTPSVGKPGRYAQRYAASWPQLAEGTQAVADELGINNYYFVLDGSGSMEERRCSGNVNKMQAAQTALVAFAEQFPSRANLGLAVFDGQGLSERLPLGQIDRQRLNQEVSKIDAEGGTPLAGAIELGYAALERQARKQLGYGEYHLIVVTDGEANAGHEPDRTVARILAESPVIIHTIGFCIDGRHSLNQAGLVDYRAADDPDSLRQSLAAVLAESPDFTVTDF